MTVPQAVQKLGPAAFLPHGAGPMPLLEAISVGHQSADGVHPKFKGKHSSMNRALQAWGSSVERPKAALVISAHFETDRPTIVGTAPHPPLLYVRSRWLPVLHTALR